MSCLLRFLLFDVFYGVYLGACICFEEWCFMFCWYSYVFIWWFKSWYKYFSERMFHYFFCWVHPTIRRSSPRERWNSSIKRALKKCKMLLTSWYHQCPTCPTDSGTFQPCQDFGQRDVLSLRSPTGCAKHVRTHKTQHQGYLDISYARSLKGTKDMERLMSIQSLLAGELRRSCF